PLALLQLAQNRLNGNSKRLLRQSTKISGHKEKAKAIFILSATAPAEEARLTAPTAYYDFVKGPAEGVAKPRGISGQSASLKAAVNMRLKRRFSA
ncbi:MAG: hypothetical protein QXF04_01605, partial [Candidatus Aenigmatarchaeota archaeon]